MKLPNLSVEQTLELLPQECILVGYRGSIVYGMSTPESDLDVAGIFISPVETYLGLSQAHTIEKAAYNYDVVLHELRKFLLLAMNANPSILELLWLNQNHYLLRSTLGNDLIRIREWFISKRCFHSFTGYAYGQLHRLDHTAPTGKMGEKRRALVRQFGFDTKNAAHAIRLLNMSIEILMDGQLHVDRSKKDAPFLRDIRAGLYSLKFIKEEAKRLQDLAQEAYVKSDLPKEPDFGLIEQWLIGRLQDKEVQKPWR